MIPFGPTAWDGAPGTLLEGMVSAGSGHASLLLSRPEVSRDIERLVGFRPYPGTLNLHLPGPFTGRLPYYLDARTLPLDELPTQQRSAGCFLGAGHVGADLRCVVLRLDRPEYAPNLVELISDRSLRLAAGLRDGDLLEVALLDLPLPRQQH